MPSDANHQNRNAAINAGIESLAEGLAGISGTPERQNPAPTAASAGIDALAQGLARLGRLQAPKPAAQPLWKGQPLGLGVPG